MGGSPEVPMVFASPKPSNATEVQQQTCWEGPVDPNGSGATVPRRLGRERSLLVGISRRLYLNIFIT